MKKGSILKSILMGAMALTFAVGMVTLQQPTKVEAATNGWVQSGDDWYYYNNGTKATGWQKVNGLWYYFGDNGVMRTGSHKIDGSLYIFNLQGQMQCSGWYDWVWVEPGSGLRYDFWFYATSSGKLLTGWQKISGWWYYFDTESGLMYSDSASKIDGNCYYFNASGQWVTTPGWVREDNVIDGWSSDEGYFTRTYTYWHYIDAAGHVKEGWFKVGNSWYYGDYNSWNETSPITNTLYDYSDGVQSSVHYGCLYNGWAQINDTWYHFNSNCQMDVDTSTKSGWYNITQLYANSGWTESHWIYIESGRTAHGWKKINNKWYFFDDVDEGLNENGEVYSSNYANGFMQIMGRNINGNYYGFNYDGSLRTGWQEIGYSDGNGVYIHVTRYLTNNGAAKGWQQIGGNWYYFIDTVYSGDFWIFYGVMATDWQAINGHWYYFGESGIMKTGWQKIDNQWYYFSSNGIMQTGWQNINGNYYYFGGNGVMQSNTWVGNYHLNASGVWDTSR